MCKKKKKDKKKKDCPCLLEVSLQFTCQFEIYSLMTLLFCYCRHHDLGAISYGSV